MDADVDAWSLSPAGTRNPWAIRKPTREHQNMTFSTTADPMPWVPKANPVSALETPDWVSSLYPSAAPGAVPPGET